MTLNPQLRSMRARTAAHASWANTSDRKARTEAGRKGLLSKFERQVDPEGLLHPTERAKRAESARRAFYTNMAYKSAARRAKKAAS